MTTNSDETRVQNGTHSSQTKNNDLSVSYQNLLRVQELYESFHSNNRPWNEHVLLPFYPKDLFAVPGNTTDAFILLALWDKQEHIDKYNCVLYKKFMKLSHKGRISLKREFDAFKGIHVSCMDPQEIESVTLCALIHGSSKVPEQYIPIKTITDCTSNYVEFFPFPLSLIDPSIDYSIEVKTNTRFDVAIQPVCLDMLMYVNRARKRLSSFRSMEKHLILNNIISSCETPCYSPKDSDTKLCKFTLADVPEEIKQKILNEIPPKPDFLWTCEAKHQEPDPLGMTSIDLEDGTKFWFLKQGYPSDHIEILMNDLPRVSKELFKILKKKGTDNCDVITFEGTSFYYGGYLLVH